MTLGRCPLSIFYFRGTPHAGESQQCEGVGDATKEASERGKRGASERGERERREKRGDRGDRERERHIEREREEVTGRGVPHCRLRRSSTKSVSICNFLAVKFTTQYDLYTL